MNDEEFENSLAVRYWLDSLKGKEDTHTTKYVWKLRFKRFCKWTNKMPDELIAERKEHLKSDDDRVKHLDEQQVKRFLDHLENEGLSPNTRRTYFTAIRNFYKRNYLELQFFRGDGPENMTSREGTRAATKEDIRAMLEVSNPRIRALVLFLKDTGLAVSDVAKLKIKDLQVKTVGDVFGLQLPVPIVVRRKKTGALTITFMGKESFDAVKTTLRIRGQGSPDWQIRHYGHAVKVGLLPEHLTVESPLFRSYEKFFARKNRKDPFDI